MADDDKRWWKLNPALLNIVLWNFAPYLGVLFLHWEPLTVFVCYALETIVIGAFNVLALIAVLLYGRVDPYEHGPADMGWFAIPAFITGYGLLAYVQLCMFFAFTGFLRVDDKENSLLYSLTLALDSKSLYIALSLFLISNTYSLLYNFILPKWYLRVTINEQMAQPFPRVILAQIVVFFGTLVFMKFDSAIGILLFFTTLKILIEAYLVNHKATVLMGWE